MIELVKRIFLTLDDDDFDELKVLKLGLTWDQLLIDPLRDQVGILSAEARDAILVQFMKERPELDDRLVKAYMLAKNRETHDSLRQFIFDMIDVGVTRYLSETEQTPKEAEA